MATRSKDRSLFGGSRGEKKEDKRTGPSEADLWNEVESIDKDLNELRSQYELYFMGVEKLEPQASRDLLKSRIRRFQESRPRNTALKFKMQQLKARMVSLENYWQRTLRQREAGNYRRDKARLARNEAERLRREQEMRRRQQTTMPTAAHGDAVSSGQAVSSGVLAAGKSGAVTDGHGAPRGRPDPGHHRPSARSAEDLTEGKLRKLYQTYVGARKRCGEGVDLRYEDMAAALRKQVPKLINNTGAKSVEFKVVIRGGKAVLKALPKN